MAIKKRKEHGANWGRRTGRTADERRSAYFETLSEEQKIESKLYVLEGRLVPPFTPDKIPSVFSPLLKYKFYCIHCKDYHSHSAGFKFCELNPDKAAAVENARKKAATHYMNGRKSEIAHGNNVKSEIKKQKSRAYHAKMSPEEKKAFFAKRRKKTFSVEGRRAYIEKTNAVTPHKLEIGLRAHDIISPMAFDHSTQETYREFSRDEFQEIESFSNRHYDVNGDFDPFS